ncbi:hypothetical protein AB0001_004748 [Salmonella enterica]|nr:hypothetical protein [Salmonella enterica]EEP3372980.1 hypothetical protein [Salmonella enterica]EFP6579687.1 hypothetical protein [Salmonella enterica]EGC7970969.1 hypothetical protein [Salmonella enterica]EIV4461152.1 hypothetical protein [Salmonella enterica]
MMIYIFAFFTLLIALLFYFMSTKIIDHVEIGVVETAKEIENGIERRQISLGFVIIYFITFNMLALSIDNTPSLLVVSLALTISSVFDIQRNWVPDLVIYITVTVSCLSVEHSFYYAITTCVIALFPFMLLNALSILKTRLTAVASGDLYMIAGISVWLTPPTAAVFSCTALFAAIISARLTKVKNLPLMPLIQASFLVSLALQKNLL